MPAQVLRRLVVGFRFPKNGLSARFRNMRIRWLKEDPAEGVKRH